ncbi:rhomboid family intramembrane serine protease [Salinibaculum rarum]|uniref:rhomboid family intramembrane serine protease n=1 Tax=Salinibaculum rarum TaxID=3058903 RepID=UPI0026601342|nr:rhomboid family intramembrane serine protease [Salinibaculum sp. KK48]
MAATDANPARDGLRWLATKRVTLGVITLLLAVFVFELFVWWHLGAAGWQYIFLAHLRPSPGWVMAPFSHRSISHLLTSLSVIVVYGGLVEETLEPATYFAFYVLAGYASTVAQLVEYLNGLAGLGTLGASGAALGLVTFFTTTTAARYRHDPTAVTTIEKLFAVTGGLIGVLILTNDFVPGIVFTTGTAPLGHAGGMAAGVWFGVVRGRAQ